MQAPTIRKSVAEGRSFDHFAKAAHKGDDDGSTSAGSSDRENDSVVQPVWSSGHVDKHGETAIVYLMDVLSNLQTPKTSSNTRSSKSSRKMKSLRQQNKMTPYPAPASDVFAAPPGLHQIKDAAIPCRFVPPPGLPLPPNVGLPPGLELFAAETESPPESFVGPYNPKVFHRELVAIFRELSQSTNVAAAVRRVRQQNVPQAHQASECCDILTRAAEECRGTHRRLYFAFAAGLAKGDSSAFEKTEVMTGVQAFFADVFEDLCEEVPRLSNIMEAELIPTLRAVFPAENLKVVLPVRFRVA